jgi:CelD/BcsL family acetyltransferase involved in cellulose biosynthesis
MGGKPLADYTGFLCLPDHEEPAIAALAAYVQQQLEWDRYHLKDVLDPRLDPFLQHIPSHAFTIRELGGTVCPYVELPGDWEEYLQRCLTAKKRQQIRRYLRGIERNKEMRITHTSAPDRDQCVEVLLGLWQQRWGNRPEHVLDMYRAVFRHCFAENHLLLPVLWDGGRAVAATAVLVDRGKKVLSGYMGGYDPGYAKISPGTTLVAYVLRYAIENGFKMFDFLRGGENYKAWFGTEERGVRHMILARRNSSRLWTGLIRQLRGKLQKLRCRS